MVLMTFGQWWQTLTGPQQIFWGIAIVFTVLFVIQFVLSLVGLDFETDTDLDVEASAGSTEGYGVDTDFTILSVRSIIAFFTFFGWTGVFVLKSGGSILLAVGLASLSGFAAMFVVAYMLYLFSKLGEDGTVDLNEAMYNTGEVYLAIPANKNGTGKIHLKVKGSLRELDAVSDGDAIPTGVPIRVVEVLNENIVLVEPAERFLP